ncbi:hypothetical protein [Streptomyces sp. NPDC004788]
MHRISWTGVPALQGGDIAVVAHLVLGVAGADPLCELCDESFEGECRVLIPRSSAGVEFLCVGVAGQGGEEHGGRRAVEVLDAAFEVGGVGRQDVDLDGERAEGFFDGVGEEVFAAVDADAGGQAAGGSVGFVGEDAGAQGCQDRSAVRVVRGDGPAHDHAGVAVAEPGDPGFDQASVGVDDDGRLFVVAFPFLVAGGRRPAQMRVVSA